MSNPYQAPQAPISPQTDRVRCGRTIRKRWWTRLPLTVPLEAGIVSLPVIVDVIVGEFYAPVGLILVLPLLGAIPCAVLASPGSWSGYVVSYVLHAMWGYVSIPILGFVLLLLYGFDEGMF